MKIAIVKLSAMGDIIHAMVALQYIKAFDATIEIDWVVEQGFVQILEHNPHIDTILPVHLKALKKDKKALFSEIKKIRGYAKKEYDLVIDAQGLLKSAITAKFLGHKRVGFSKNSIRESIASYFYTDKVDIAYDANTIDRNVRVIAVPLGLEITPNMIVEKEPFLFYQENQEITTLLRQEKRNIVFVIGSTWESRNYPKEKFVEIANALEEQVWVVWGTQQERERALWIEAESRYAKVLPKMDLNGLKAVIGISDLVIGNDTGPTHMAWAMHRPSITIFGPTPVNRVYETEINRVINSSSTVNHYKLNKNDFSIREIASSRVITLAKELLGA